MTDNVIIRLLDKDEDAVLSKIAEDVFDNTVAFDLTKEFLADKRHHITVALDNGLVVGMATALHYVHPDKAAELWINEVGVAPGHQGKGIGKKLIKALLKHGKSLGCKEAWVLTEVHNTAARRLYSSAGGVEESERPVYFTFNLADDA